MQKQEDAKLGAYGQTTMLGPPEPRLLRPELYLQCPRGSRFSKRDFGQAFGKRGRSNGQRTHQVIFLIIQRAPSRTTRISKVPLRCCRSPWAPTNSPEYVPETSASSLSRKSQLKILQLRENRLAPSKHGPKTIKIALIDVRRKSKASGYA